jgi:cell division protein FtsL
MMMMTSPEGIMLILFGIVIVFLLFTVKLMHTRINQLLAEMSSLSGKVNLTSSEIEELTKNVEEFKTTNF